jgi:hypothetical protein
MLCGDETITRCGVCAASPRSLSARESRSSSSDAWRPISASPTPSITGPGWPFNTTSGAGRNTPHCVIGIMVMLAHSAPSPIASSPSPAPCSKAKACSIQPSLGKGLSTSPETHFTNGGEFPPSGRLMTSSPPASGSSATRPGLRHHRLWPLGRDRRPSPRTTARQQPAAAAPAPGRSPGPLNRTIAAARERRGRPRRAGRWGNPPPILGLLSRQGLPPTSPAGQNGLPFLSAPFSLLTEAIALHADTLTGGGRLRTAEPRSRYLSRALWKALAEAQACPAVLGAHTWLPTWWSCRIGHARAWDRPGSLPLPPSPAAARA